MRRLLLAVLLAALAATAVAGPATAAPAPGPLPTIGIGDQKPEMFTDPLFTGLGLTHARLVIPWDVMTVGWQRNALRTWLEDARAAGVSPLLTFGHSRRPGHEKQRPGPRQLQHQFRRLRVNFPWVRDWATWNEPNHCGEPLCHDPQLAARYFDALRRACPSCRVVAAEVLDLPNMASWVRRFRRAAHSEPRIWGLHNYVDTNRLRTSGTRALLAATHGEIWFTETGGIVSRKAKVRIPFPESAAHAAIATRWLFDRLVPLSPRIKRVYLYHWNPSGPLDTWDSALLDVHGRPRAAYRVLRARLTRARAAAALGR